MESDLSEEFGMKDYIFTALFARFPKSASVCSCLNHRVEVVLVISAA